MSKKAYKKLLKEKKVVAIPFVKGDKTLYHIMSVEEARKYLD